MLILIHGSDQLKRSEETEKVLKQYKSDDFNFQEIDTKSPITEISSAMQQAPMFVDWYLVVIHTTKKHLLKIEPYIKPSEFTCCVLICDDGSLAQETISNLNPDTILDCKPLSFMESVKWVARKSKELGFNLDLEDRKKLVLMCQNSHELSGILFQMSMLNDFDRRAFFNDLFKTRQEFVWNLFIALVNGDNKLFFKRYAEQISINMEMTKSQFDMKILGGLLFCLSRWEDAPEWIHKQLKNLEENGEFIVPFLHSHLIELLVVARKEQSNIPLLAKFVSIMQQVKKFS